MKNKFKIGDEVTLNINPQPDRQGIIQEYDEIEKLFIGIKGIVLDEDYCPWVRFISDEILYKDDGSGDNVIVCDEWNLLPWVEPITYNITNIIDNLDKLENKFK